jgi:MerR family mercuric resistance operon transcriptional regulator
VIVPGNSQFTIGRLARKARIPVTTVRYYERIGLLVPEQRSCGNYRLYGLTSLRRLRFIRAAQAIGFTLEDVKQLLGPIAEDSSPCRHVQTLIQLRLADIEQRLRDLRQVQQVLKSSLAKCQKTEGPGCCHVVETLARTS